jgi:outer membrane protein TolC
MNHKRIQDYLRSSLNRLLRRHHLHALLRCLLASATLALMATPAAADTTAETARIAPTLESLLSELKRSNPQLEQARLNWRAAQTAGAQAGALAGPEISVNEQSNTGGPFDFKRSSDFFAYTTLTQSLPWPGKRRLAAEIADEQAAAVGSQYDSLLIQLSGTLQLSVYQLSALREQRRFMDEDLDRLRQLREVAQVRYANNAAAYVEYLNAQVAASSLENDRYALDRQIEGLVAQIDTLLGRPAQSPLALADEPLKPSLPPQTLEQLVALALDTNPLLSGDAHQLAAADKTVDLAHKAFLPDLQFSAGVYSDPSLVQLQTTRMSMVGVGIALPSWGFAKEKAGLSQAEAQRDAARAGATADRQQVELAVTTAYQGLQTALKQLEFVRDRQLPQSQMAWRIALTGYESGGATAFSDLLTAQSALRATELSLVQARNAAVQAAVALAAAIGRAPG